MSKRHLLPLLVCGLVLGLGACQHFTALSQWTGLHPAQAPALKVRAIAADAPQRTPAMAADSYYEQAVAAIDKRDYGLALDMLQVARDAKADDPRVLTAMGVVYDKLGRFDLSKRYYDLAEAADPGSKVVARDRAYSLVLQDRVGAARAPEAVVMADAAPLPRLALASQTLSAAPAKPVNIALLASTASRFSGGVRVRNATGAPDGAEPIRASLAGKGWRLGHAATSVQPTDTTTRVRFPAAGARAASGLARTMPFPVKLEPCDTCTVVELFIGSDALPKANSGRPAEARRG